MRFGHRLWIASWSVVTAVCLSAGSMNAAEPVSRGYSIPLVDISAEKARQVIVDREAKQYLGHPTTLLLEDGKTILCVYPKGHGKGGIVYKRSTDGGLTWSDRLPVPANWSTSLEVPTLHRTVDAKEETRDHVVGTLSGSLGCE
ncbi:MAG: hypothetical protein U0894_05710 [Pirellulales bacterium]